VQRAVDENRYCSDITAVAADLFAKYQTSFYKSLADAVTAINLAYSKQIEQPEQSWRDRQWLNRQPH